jgi:hypothetical protein
MADSSPPPSQPQGRIQFSRGPGGEFVAQITDNGQTRTLRMPGDQARALLWMAIGALSTPSDPPAQPLPTGTAGMPTVSDAVWLAGPVPEGAQVALWIPGLGFCAFSFNRDSCARLGAFLVQAAQMAAPAPSTAPH